MIVGGIGTYTSRLFGVGIMSVGGNVGGIH